jgi:DNA-binding NarL/FixJ family response regulator
VLVLSSLKEPREVLAAVRAGASGYLVKTAEADEIAQAIHLVHHGQLAFPPELAQLVLAELRSSKPAASLIERARLTPQERRVLELMASGHSNHAIGRALRLAPKTVEAHVTAIFSKMGLESTPDQHRRVQAVLAYLHDVQHA